MMKLLKTIIDMALPIAIAAGMITLLVAVIQSIQSLL
jgi:hypothetical protein